MSLGFEMAGFETLAAADRDANANQTFALNRPGTEPPIDLDLSDSDERGVVLKEIKRRAGSAGVDVLLGGPPCQGFSTAGNCDPFDARNRLVFSFVAAVEELRPRALLMENVAAILFRRGVGVLRIVVRSLEAMGYTTSIAIAHAEGYGVPQLRRRFFLAAASGGVKWPDPWCELMAPGHFRLQPHRSDIPRRAVHTVRDAMEDLPARQVAHPDESTSYASVATSDYQRWLRGEASPSTIVPDPSWVVAERATLRLATAALRTRR